MISSLVFFCYCVYRTILEESVETVTTPRTVTGRREARIVLTSVHDSAAVITSTAKKESRKTVTTTSSSSSVVNESKQNEKNLLLETSIEAIKKNMSVQNGSKTTIEANNVAYKEYKDAGEYWNKTPKTDYTYSELSPHRREIAPNTVAMPNMSRSGLDKHEQRVNVMMSRSPAQASYIRQRYAASAAHKPKPRLEYDSGDEIDLSQYSRTQAVYRESYFRRLTRTITTLLTSIFTSITTVFAFKQQHQDNLYYTRIHKETLLSRTVQSVVSAWLAVLKQFYIVTSTILTIDTWLLMSRANKLMGERKRRFLLLLVFLLPLLLLGGKSVRRFFFIH